jgi:hypothetical protein
MNKITEKIDGSAGFFTGIGFTVDELCLVRGLIKSQWLNCIEDYQTGLSKRFEIIEMDRYHELSYLLPHENIWTKEKRILRAPARDLIRKTTLIKALESEFGLFKISGEDGFEKEEIYWRLVRPNNTNDVGPIHADGWFWELGNWPTPAQHRRLKVWISIYSEPGKNGFKYIEGSHKKKWKYRGEIRDGYLKPVFDECVSNLQTEFFHGTPGQAIIFNDNLLHGGVVGGSTTRVSLEFTMFVKE